MDSILYIAPVLISMFPNAPDLPQSFSIKSLDAIEAKCPRFEKQVSDAILIFTCFHDKRSLMMTKALIFDGRSFIRDPDTHAKKILLDVRNILHEEFTISERTTFCEVLKDSYGRCKTAYTLVGAKGFDSATLVINPVDDRIDGFSYFVGLSWQHRN